jgi:surface polysaccharide O-acyltransferase-like enzyme
MIQLTQDTLFIASFEKITAITEIETSTIAIFPNPATDNINIVLPENVHQAVFILYDMQGKVLIRREINSQDAVSVDGLATGIYFYNVRTEKEKYTGKLVIRN